MGQKAVNFRSINRIRENLGDLNVDGSLAVDSVLVEVGSGEGNLGKLVHVTASIGAGKTLLDISGFLLNKISTYFPISHFHLN